MTKGYFTDAEIAEIRSDPRSSTDVAEEYGCCSSYVRHIRLGLVRPDGPWPDELPDWPIGNHGKRFHVGEDNPASVLTEKSVRWLRDQHDRFGTPHSGLARKVARRFRLRREPSPQAVGCAIRGQTWGEVG